MIEGKNKVSLYEQYFGQSWMQMKCGEKGLEMESGLRSREKVCFRMIKSRTNSYVEGKN